ncbi:hypothetical protein [Pseudomonas putida]|jgi:hypothetical protein|uniref:hypothetical protein n=1 Tax=Pseudomonas putida TaxID=303 RepID=UPI00126024A6|nr:hypothetical protein [Pseudomonas putida]
MPTSKSRHANKAENHGLTGKATLQQMWERIYPRCAARAALDLAGAEALATCTWQPIDWLFTSIRKKNKLNKSTKPADAGSTTPIARRTTT